MPMRPPIFAGLDFGTSNSTLGIAGPHTPARLLPLEAGRLTIPTAIFFDFENDRTLFGRAAFEAYVNGTDGRLMRALKSILGSSLGDESVRIKRRVIPFLDIVGRFVGELKQRAEAEAGAELDTVVVGRPVHFSDDDPAADRLAQDQLEGAVRAQGFRHIAFQFEPIAAALDYEQQVRREELCLVVDLGGGTSDFSVIRVSPEQARIAERSADILSTAGVHVGGTDFDRLLSLRAIMPQLGYGTETLDGKRLLPAAPYADLSTWHRINRLYTPQLLAELKHTTKEARRPDLAQRMVSVVEHREGHRLASAVEDAKIALTDAVVAEFGFTGEEVRIGRELDRVELERVLDDSIARIEQAVSRALHGAGVAAGAIDTLILTGGSTQIPAILSRLRTMFPEAGFVNTDAFGSVGLGLAIDAARRFG